MQGWFYEKGGDSRLVIATGNRGKLVEIAALLKTCVSDCRPLKAFGAPEVEETGATYAENALLKARAAFRHSGWASLADDSGFEVEALDGEPGLRSARWAETENGTRDFARAIERVQKEMQARSCTCSPARFVCALALVRNDGAEQVVEGEVQGRVVFPPRGDKGFGYDPIFLPFDAKDARTFGEIDRQEKQRISHRAQAFHRLRARCFASHVAGSVAGEAL